MKRSQLVQKLIKEGFSEKTLVNFSDKQLYDLSERILGEAVMKQVKVLSMANKEDAKVVNTLVNDPKAVEKQATQAPIQVTKEEKKLSKNQSDKMDTDKDGDIDSKDLKNLRSKKKKVEVKEGLFGGKLKKVDTIKHGGHEMDVWSDGKEKLIGHPRKKGEKSSAETQNSEKLLGYSEDKLDKLKKSIDDMNSGKKDVSFPIHKKKFSNPKFKDTKVDINEKKESVEVKNWVKKLSESNYHSFTSKNEIMELIQSKMTQHEVGPNVKKGHNGVPEFMSYDSIAKSEVKEGGTKTKPAPTKPKTSPGTKPKTPYQPGPGKNPKPKALKEDK